MAKDGSSAYRPCVGAMLVNRDGHVFVGERIDTPGAWQMPQGGIDKGESVEEAGLRELEEEIGLAPSMVSLAATTSDWLYYDLPDHLVGKLWGGKFRGQKQKWVLLRFEGRDADIDIRTEHPEFARWKWVSPDRVLEEIVPFKRAVYAAVLAEFSDRI